MKQHIFTLILMSSLLFSSKSFAQWRSLGDNIIPLNHRVWSLKVAPDKSVWAIATFDRFPPTNQVPKIYRSTNEGVNWTNSIIPAAISTYGWDISPIDSNNAFVAVDTAGLYRTLDGGLNWNKVASYPYSCLLVHFFNKNEGWVFGRDTAGFLVMSVTKNGGDTWTHIGGSTWHQPQGTSLPPLDLTERLPTFTFSVNSSYDYNQQSIMIGSSKGNYWLSRDKGFNWTRHATPLTNLGIRASNIAMKDENTFMVAGDIPATTNNGIATVNFTTRDGGMNWIKGNSGLTAAASHYIPNSDSVFVMVGHNNFGWGSEGTAISYNYGKDWQKLDNSRIIAIDFLDKNTGYGSCCNNSWATAKGQIHKWNFSLPTSTINIAKSDLVKIMPNPVTTTLTIVLNNEFQSDKLTIDIISTNGQLVSSYQISTKDQVNIPTHNLPKGHYSLRITDNQKRIIKNFIKE